MEIPRFENKNINPRLVSADIGDAFQVFVHELLLPEHPHMHRFPGGGKDGGIDLIDLIEESRTSFVVECKVVGKDDYNKIEQRWKTVKDHLEKHLRNPSGPTKGQSQYMPWYSSDSPIVEYVFSVTSAFANEQQRRDFKNEITDFFRDLTKRRQHLSHLSTLKISVIDWNDLCDLLKKRPHSIFRWFPSLRPNGLVPLDESADAGTFRSYLNSAKLPYYSLEEHLRTKPAPEGVLILNEESLLASFEKPDITGLVIKGKGGIGKSRLMLELGWRALAEGWTVMRVRGRLKDGTLEEFAERLTPQTSGLLLVDYIETQSDFVELVESINVINDSGVARLHYIAVCRTGYYQQAIAAYGRHLPVDLSPLQGDVTLEWFIKYRTETVERILTKAGIVVTDRQVTICHDIPILAVFMAYLHTSNRTEDLSELLSENEFGRWVGRRVQLTFPAKDVSRELALLVTLFPMAESTAALLHPERLRPIFDRLATDGWIERVTESENGLYNEWVSAHDVLADQILLSYLRSIPNTAEVFIADLFAIAAELGCLSSTVIALQRVADSPPLNVLPWANIITNAINANETSWQSVRNLLIKTNLLHKPDLIGLLHSHDRIWAGAEMDITFQNALGWLARWKVTAINVSIPDRYKQDLIAWIIKAASFAERSNFVITWGLRLAPETMRDIALRWISTRPNLFQTHYLFVAWLESGLPPQSIAVFLHMWCQKFSKTFHLSFVIKSWLDAGGDKALIETAIKEWLGEHKTKIEADFVYKSWLDAGGDVTLIEAALKDWLVKHKTNIEAEFVYKSWLDAGGDKTFVDAAIKEWLGEHKKEPEACYIYKSWLNAGGEKSFVETAIKEWLNEHKKDLDAGFIYKSWLDAGGDKALVQIAINDWLGEHKNNADAQYVYSSWLDAGGDKLLVEAAIKDWLGEHKNNANAQYVYTSWLDAGGDKLLVEAAIKDWLGEHKNNVDAQYVYTSWLDAGGDKLLVEAAIKDWLVGHKNDTVACFVYKSWLDAGGEKKLVELAIKDWLNLHECDAEADFFYRAWLENGGEPSIVWDSLLNWLAKHRTEESAVYVTKFMAKQSNLPTNTVKHILEWCRTFLTNDDVLWRLTQLSKNFFAAGVAGDVIMTSELVLEKYFLSIDHLDIITRGQITSLISYLIQLSEKSPGTLRDRVDILFVRWLRHPMSFGDNPIPHLNIQRISYLERFEVLINAGILTIERDRESVKRFMQWLDKWDFTRKRHLIQILNDIKDRYPSPGLWNIVKFIE